MSDEDVAAWREERRRNWPTREKGEAHREKLAQKRRRISTVEARKREEYELERVFRQEAKEEARARAAVERDRRAADKTVENAENKPKRAGKARKNKDPAPFPRWSDDSEDEDTCDGIPRFRGTAGFVVSEGRGENEDEQRGEEMTTDSFAISDDEIMDDEEAKSTVEELKIVVVDNDDDDSEPPEEIKLKKQPETQVPASAPQKLSTTLTKPNATLQQRKNLLPQAKKLDEESLPPQMALRRRIFRLRMRQTWRQEGPVPSTLLERLLEKDISTERTELLQCVKYVCENNFFGMGGSQKNQEEDMNSPPGSELEML